MRVLIYYLLFIILASAKSIGFIENGKMDRFENAYAIIQRGSQTIVADRLGVKLKENDLIKTFRKSTITIRLKDGTLIKIGKKTTLKIDKYFFDNKNKSKNIANFKIKNGSFRIKTGKIGDNTPRNFKIKTKFSTIGLRG